MSDWTSVGVAAVTFSHRAERRIHHRIRGATAPAAGAALPLAIGPPIGAPPA
jgi:hypothetical protein